MACHASPESAKPAMVTLKQIAAEVGVSQATVSRVLNFDATLRVDAVKVYQSEAQPDPWMLAQTSGLICIGLHDAAEMDWLKTHARHVVCADFTPADDEIDAVESDLPAALRKFLTSLTEAGYRRIGFVGWWDHDRQGRIKAREKRCTAYIDWMTAGSL